LTYRLLHIADLHLDRAFAATGCQGELARRRRQGLRDALRRAGELAVQRGCDAVTIAGDLYEHERSGVDTARFLAETFAAWRPLRVFIAPGNHDPLLPGSIYLRTDWPDNVTLYTASRLEPVALADGLTLWGIAHRDPAWRGNPLEGVGSAGSGVHLALFHGSEMGSRPEGKAAHGPFTAAEIRAAGFVAALCGHYHGRRVDAAAGLLYPGSPEPLGFDETGERGPTLVEIGPGGSVRYEPLSTNRWAAVCVTCDVEGTASVQGVLDALAGACEPELADIDRDCALVRVDLIGTVPCTLSLDAFTIESTAREQLAVALVRVRDLTSAGHDVAAALRERGTRGAFARAAAAAAERAASEEDAALVADALRYGLTALAGAEVGLR
jgi:hypothetical protein